MYFILIWFLNILRKFSLRVLNLEEKNPLLLKNKDDFWDYFLLLTFLGVIFLSIKFNTSQFNGWRQLYFLYFIIIYFVAHLMKSLLHLKNQYLKQIIFFFNIYQYCFQYSLDNKKSSLSK